MTAAPPRRLALALLLAPLALGACSSTPDPTVMQFDVRVAGDVNPNSAGTPSPVVVRVYELSNPDAFMNADFFALYDGDQQTLKGTMLGRSEFEFPPGKTDTITRQAAPNTRFIGVLAAFRAIDGATWRTTAPITAEKSNRYVVSVQGSSVAVQGAGTSGGWFDWF